MIAIVQKLNTQLSNYLQLPGDSKELLLHKKIWWVINFAGFFILLLAMLSVADPQYGMGKDVVDVIFLLAMPALLIGFHFSKGRIEEWAFVSQIALVTICSAKVYLMGGLLLAGAPIFIGLIGPIYALILPNKRRAIAVCTYYLILMITATLMQPTQPPGLSVGLYIYGFAFGISQIFIVLWFFTTQVEKLKQREVQRMAELDNLKTKFYTNITHEFRTPLTIILGLAEQLSSERREPTTVEREEALRLIKRNGQQLLSLTNQMLDLAKLEANAMPLQLVKDDIVRYLKYLVESFHSMAAKKNIRLEFSAHPETIEMDFDPDKMQDILSNLLSNAIKFTPSKGLVQVSAAQVQEELTLTVRDTGPGIAPEYLPRVFERYFRIEELAETGEGTGLGLALTRELVKLLQGKITVESFIEKEADSGSVFRVQLPITRQAPPAEVPIGTEQTPSKSLSPTIEEATFSPTSSNEEKLVILIVEDNDDVRRYLRSLLADSYQIEEARNGLEGHEKAIRIIPDLVISDVMMPQMDGFALCQALKNDLRTSHIPVVLLTARADPDSKLEGLEVGADAYLPKPFQQEELFVRIKKLIELRQALQTKYADLSSMPEAHYANTSYQKENTFLQDVRSLLLEHLDDEEFGIAALCRQLGMSRSQLYRKFNALTDTTVHHFIRNLRLIKARELLHFTDLSVTEVAFETGFKNHSHFSRVFRETMGQSPSKYRQKQLLDK